MHSRTLTAHRQWSILRYRPQYRAPVVFLLRLESWVVNFIQPWGCRTSCLRHYEEPVATADDLWAGLISPPLRMTLPAKVSSSARAAASSRLACSTMYATAPRQPYFIRSFRSTGLGFRRSWPVMVSTYPHTLQKNSMST